MGVRLLLAMCPHGLTNLLSSVLIHRVLKDGALPEEDRGANVLFALPQQSSKLCPGTKIGFSKTESLPEEDLGVKVLLGRANGVNSSQELELLEPFDELAPCIPKHKCKQLCCTMFTSVRL